MALQTIAVVGLGAMGMPMSRNLQEAGYTVRGADLSPAALEALRISGGFATTSAAEAAEGADLLILMVVNAAQAEAVLFDEGVLLRMPEGSAICLMATCPPPAVQAIAQRVSAAGRRFVDAPVSGGVAGAISGKLTIMAACESALFDELEPVFRTLGDRVFHVGLHPGQGAAVKTVNQLLCGVHIAAAAEAFALAAKFGVAPQTLLEIMSGSSASSWMLRDRGPRMLQSDPEVTSAVDIFVKDLSIVLHAGHGSGAALPLAAAAHQMFVAASGAGDGRADDSQVIRSYYRLNGMANER